MYNVRELINEQHTKRDETVKKLLTNVLRDLNKQIEEKVEEDDYAFTLNDNFICLEVEMPRDTPELFDNLFEYSLIRLSEYSLNVDDVTYRLHLLNKNEKNSPNSKLIIDVENHPNEISRLSINYRPDTSKIKLIVG